jgi:hypothetical protein
MVSKPPLLRNASTTLSWNPRKNLRGRHEALNQFLLEFFENIQLKIGSPHLNTTGLK